LMMTKDVGFNDSTKISLVFLRPKTIIKWDIFFAQNG
jgi:hypothetical protein